MVNNLFSIYIKLENILDLTRVDNFCVVTRTTVLPPSSINISSLNIEFKTRLVCMCIGNRQVATTPILWNSNNSPILCFAFSRNNPVSHRLCILILHRYSEASLIQTPLIQIIHLSRYLFGSQFWLYVEKLTHLFRYSFIRSVILRMEVSG